MWVGQWLHGDAAPIVGDLLDGVGVRARCTTIDPGTDSHDAVQPEGPGSDGRPSVVHRVRGVASPARDFTADRGGGQMVHAGSEWVLTIRGADEDLLLLGSSDRDARLIPMGPVTALCEL